MATWAIDGHWGLEIVLAYATTQRFVKQLQTGSGGQKVSGIGHIVQRESIEHGFEQVRGG